MLEKYTTEREIGPSICDADGRLSYAESFGLFMDIASIHAGQLGNGVLDMAGMGLFWLTVKTQINFINRPQITQMVHGRNSTAECGATAAMFCGAAMK